MLLLPVVVVLASSHARDQDAAGIVAFEELQPNPQFGAGAVVGDRPEEGAAGGTGGRRTVP
jgi:hypothetical protein